MKRKIKKVPENENYTLEQLLQFRKEALETIDVWRLDEIKRIINKKLKVLNIPAEQILNYINK